MYENGDGEKRYNSVYTVEEGVAEKPNLLI